MTRTRSQLRRRWTSAGTFVRTVLRSVGRSVIIDVDESEGDRRPLCNSDVVTATDARHRYLDRVIGNAATDLGAEISTGTTVVGSSAREGSTVAVAYPLGDRTIVWCATDVATRLASLAGPSALTGDEFVAAAQKLGGSFVGAGNHRVLQRAPNVEQAEGYRLVTLDRDIAADRKVLAAFVAACPDDDLDEAELAMDDLDPAIVALVDDTGAIASYSSVRPWEIAPEFDDIAVITHPEHRRKRLGAVVVGELAARRLAEGRELLYSCGIDNAGSNAVAERVGFDLVCAVVAVDIG